MRLPPSVARLGLQLRPRVPDPIWRGLLELGSLVTDAPTIGLPDFRRVLVLAPHPDDETIGCGGTLALLADGGARVEVLLATDGEATIGPALPASEIARRRRAETVTALELLGVDTAPRCLGLPDGDLVHHGRILTASVQEAIDDLHPDLVLSPWLLEAHPDHRALAHALARTEPSRDLQVWGYEAHTPVIATQVVGITDVIDRKRAALAAHGTAAEAFDLEATLGLNRWRSLATDQGRGLAEAFHTATWDDYISRAALVPLR